ncbi:MAG: Uma2 family endonuclease [Firmicutes bacterium]|nr:Uma2 family endonuclease [Bacillota bacterium]
MPHDKELMTAHALSTALNLSADTIWRYTREKKIPYIELGNKKYRYNLNDVVNTLSQSNVKEKTPNYDTTKEYTYEDYLALPQERGFRFEVLEGELIKEPSPTVSHQKAVSELHFLLKQYFKEADSHGEVFVSPLDITFSDTTVVQPDVLYVSGEQKEIIQPLGIDGPPMLVVEVLSPTSGRKDRIRKMQIYQRGNVQHYWLVNPEDKMIECFALRNGLYALVASGMDGETVKHPVFEGLSIDLSLLWML